MAGWGTSGWGTTTWGAGAAAAGFAVDEAWAMATNLVRVVFTGPPAAIYPHSVGDALNVASWVARENLGNTVFTVIEIRKVNSVTFDVVILEDFEGVLVVHEIDASLVKNTAGVLISVPRSADYFGAQADVVVLDAEALAARRTTITDFRNPVFNDDGIGGSLRVKSGTDYEMHSGTDVVRKLIYRRLITVPGELRHLPDYGVGLRIKEPLPTSDLARLKAQIVSQVGQEPEVEAVKATLTWSPSTQVLIVALRIKLAQTGTETDLSYTFPFGGVQL